MKGYTKKELALIAGYTYQRLYTIDLSLPEGKKLFVPSPDGKYDIQVFVRNWVAYHEHGPKEEMSLDQAKTVHEQVKMEKTRLEVDRLRGQLVDVDDVRRLWANVATTVVQNLIRLPSKIAPQLIMQRDADVIAGLIDREIRDVLEVIADTPLPGEQAVTDTTETEESETEE